MSRKRNLKLRVLGQMNATKETISAKVQALFPHNGKRTAGKIASLIQRYITGKQRI